VDVDVDVDVDLDVDVDVATVLAGADFTGDDAQGSFADAPGDAGHGLTVTGAAMQHPGRQGPTKGVLVKPWCVCRMSMLIRWIAWTWTWTWTWTWLTAAVSRAAEVGVGRGCRRREEDCPLPGRARGPRRTTEVGPSGWSEVVAQPPVRLGWSVVVAQPPVRLIGGSVVMAQPPCDKGECR